MAQHDYSIANQGFPATRADINNVLSAIATNNSGTSAPSTQYAGQFWIDTTSTTWTLYIHDGADDIQFATIDTSANTVNFIDSELGDNSVTTAKLEDDAVTTAKISDGAITDAKLAASAINSQTAETTHADDDEILIYDTSASALRKMTRANFVGAMDLLHTAESTTNVSEIDFSSYVSSTYDEYVLYFSSLPATDLVALRLRLRSGGSFIDSSDYGNAALRIDSTSRVTHTTNGGTRFEIMGNETQGNASGENVQAIIRLTNMNSASFSTACFWESTFYSGGGSHTNFFGNGSLNTHTTVCDGFKLFYSVGDFSAYEYRFYGIRNS